MIVILAGKALNDKHRIKRMTFLIAPVIFYLVINTVLTGALNAKGGEHQEMLLLLLVLAMCL